MKSACNDADLADLAIFWDYENCPVPTNSTGCQIAKTICTFTRPFGRVKAFKAYFETSEHSSLLRSELQASGVTLVDCPHNGKKEVADKMILVDMMAYAIDNPVGSTIVLITGDRDFAYALSTLTLRRYRVILIAGSNARHDLTIQADKRYDWVEDIVKPSDGPGLQQPSAQKSREPSTLQGAERVSDGRSTCSMDPVDTAGSAGGETVDAAPWSRYAQRPLPASQFHPARSGRQTHHREDLPANGARPNTPLDNHPPRSSPHALGSKLPNQSAHLVKTTTVDAEPRSPFPSTDAEEPDRLAAQLMQGRQLEKQQQGADVSKPTAAADVASRAAASAYQSERQAAPSGSAVTQEEANAPLESNGAVPTERTLEFIQVSSVLKTDGFSPPPPPLLPPLANRTTTTSPPVVFSPQLQRLILATPSTPHRNLEPDEAKKKPLGGGAAGATLLRTPQRAGPVPLPLLASPPPVRTEPEPEPGPEPLPDLIAPPIFAILVEVLQSHIKRGTPRPTRSVVALQVSKEGTTYKKAGVGSFWAYMGLARNAGIVELGGKDANAWVALRPKWFNAVLPPP